MKTNNINKNSCARNCTCEVSYRVYFSGTYLDFCDKHHKKIENERFIDFLHSLESKCINTDNRKLRDEQTLIQKFEEEISLYSKDSKMALLFLLEYLYNNKSVSKYGFTIELKDEQESNEKNI